MGSILTALKTFCLQLNGGSDGRRLTIKLNKRQLDTFKSLAAKNGKQLHEVIASAFALYKVVSDNVVDGKKLCILDGDDVVQEIVGF